MLNVFLEYSFDSAHFLPNVPLDHKCHRMHGHRYELRIEISGTPNAIGWIIDYSDIKIVADRIVDQLDHHTLNDVRGLENPTCENLVVWVLGRISREFPSVSLIEIRETDRAGCVWRR